MKIFAFYLPQYHPIPENDQWWGKGFTEWTNVKKAVPLFDGHHQPRIPLDHHYYSLLEPQTLRWQASLMQRYKVDGLCFYHYWFKGKKLLEKPAEILLEHKDIQLPFCFSWANEPWTRSWDGLTQNILIEQNYGEEADWIEHFEYLLPFFQDSRYIRHHGHPVFILYRSASFERCDAWISCWRAQAKLHGLDDIHFVLSLTSFENDPRPLDFNARLYFEPMNTTAHYLPHRKKSFQEKIDQKITRIIGKPQEDSKISVENFNYHHAWEMIIDKAFDEQTYAGAFIDWDNTPRKQQKGAVAQYASPENFARYFPKLYQKARKMNSPYIFINAWNEWAEGAYLEPDTQYQYQYLEIIQKTVNGAS